MKKYMQHLTLSCTTLLGLTLWGGLASQFEAEDKLTFEPNPGCVKGSPYGKVLALAMQGPIDFYWHQGQTHEHIHILNADDHHDDGCANCGPECESKTSGDSHVAHAHSDHDHSHGHDHDHEQADSCGCCPEEPAPQMVTAETHKPLHTLAKERIEKMEAVAHRKTNGKPLSPAHQKYLQSVTEDKLRLAYELDPTNYTNYGNLHLFIATTNFGKGEADDSKAVALARETLSFCQHEEVDPSTWLTAASAAYNIIYHIGRYHDQFSVEEAKASLVDFDQCMETFENLLIKAVEEGRIVSEARFNELNTRAKYLKKLRTAQGVYMKRMMSTKVAEHTSSHPLSVK
ncbi:hypothetical protein JIN77_06410 [Verrucomicrobiaceae bacterium R5-34]|nr:hypothetical protein [Verrucomicrobiaceae bacterium R5-34]